MIWPKDSFVFCVGVIWPKASLVLILLWHQGVFFPDHPNAKKSFGQIVPLPVVNVPNFILGV